MKISFQYFVGSWSKSIGSPSSELVTPWKSIVSLLGWFRWGGVYLCFLLSMYPVDMSNDKPQLFVVSCVHNVLISHWDVNLLIGWRYRMVLPVECYWECRRHIPTCPDVQVFITFVYHNFSMREWHNINIFSDTLLLMHLQCRSKVLHINFMGFLWPPHLVDGGRTPLLIVNHCQSLPLTINWK